MPTASPCQILPGKEDRIVASNRVFNQGTPAVKPSVAAARTLALSAMVLALAACGASIPAEEDVKAAFQKWHEQTYDVDAPQEFQSVVGTQTIVNWPNCVLVNAFDLGGKWMTLTMQDNEIVEVVAGHHAGRTDYASERGCE